MMGSSEESLNNLGLVETRGSALGGAGNGGGGGGARGDGGGAGGGGAGGGKGDGGLDPGGRSLGVLGLDPGVPGLSPSFCFREGVERELELRLDGGLSLSILSGLLSPGRPLPLSR